MAVLIHEKLQLHQQLHPYPQLFLVFVLGSCTGERISVVGVV